VEVQVSRPVSTPVATTKGARLVSHAGVGMLAELADLSGLTAGLTSLFEPKDRRHAPGVTLVRAASAIADGMRNVSTVSLFCGSRPTIFAEPASRSTVARTVIEFGHDLMTPRLDELMATVRRTVWDAAGYAPESLILDVDATLLNVHSDKQDAAPTFKRGFGFHPLAMFLNETREPLAMIFGPGNAGSNTAADHCDVLMRSIDQLPAEYRAGHEHGDPPQTAIHPILVRSDAAGSTKAFLAELVGRNIEFSVGFQVNDQYRALIEQMPDEAWTRAINTDGTPRRKAEVVELCGFTGLNGWPGSPAVVPSRRTPPRSETLTVRPGPRPAPHPLPHQHPRPQRC